MWFIDAFLSTSSMFEIADGANHICLHCQLRLGAMRGLRLFSFSFTFVCLVIVRAQPTFPEGIDQIVSGIGTQMAQMKLPEGCYRCA